MTKPTMDLMREDYFDCKGDVSNQSQCEDMDSYKKGLQEGRDQKRGSQYIGEISSCKEVWELLYPDTDYKCFCQEYYIGFNE